MAERGAARRLRDDRRSATGPPCRTAPSSTPVRSFPTIVGAGCVIGHLAHLEGCTMEDESLVGSGSVVLHWAVVGTGATVGANAVVPNRMEVPPGALAVGVPAQIRPDRSNLTRHPAVGRGVRGQRPPLPGVAWSAWTSSGRRARLRPTGTTEQGEGAPEREGRGERQDAAHRRHGRDRAGRGDRARSIRPSRWTGSTPTS